MKKKSENDLKLHREEANEGYKTITKMTKIVKEDPHKLVIAVDLQQALPDLSRYLYVISDNCFGQNKKLNIIHMWHNIVADKFDNIFHICPISGNIKKNISSHVQAMYTRDQIGQNKK